MRYAIFQIPNHRLLTKGGWDDFFFWTDDLEDARKIVSRDPGEEVHHAFGHDRRPDRQTYQIVDLQTGNVIVDTRLVEDRIIFGTESQ